MKFRIGADDATFLYLNGNLVADLGGVRPRQDLPVVTATLPAGDYCLSLFYADLYPEHAELLFSVDTGDVTVMSAPELAGREVQSSPAGCAVPIS